MSYFFSIGWRCISWFLSTLELSISQSEIIFSLCYTSVCVHLSYILFVHHLFDWLFGFALLFFSYLALNFSYDTHWTLHRVSSLSSLTLYILWLQKVVFTFSRALLLSSIILCFPLLILQLHVGTCFLSSELCVWSFYWLSFIRYFTLVYIKETLIKNIKFLRALLAKYFHFSWIFGFF